MEQPDAPQKSEKFYLESGDFRCDIPFTCEVVREVSGQHKNSHYFLVKITPTLKSSFQGGPKLDFNHIVLALVGDKTLDDMKLGPVMTDVVICPEVPEHIIDEYKCSRLGVGSLHTNYSDAVAHMPRY